MRLVEVELVCLREEISKDIGMLCILFSSCELDIDEIMWLCFKVGSEWLDCSFVVLVCDSEVMGDGSVMFFNI